MKAGPFSDLSGVRVVGAQMVDRLGTPRAVASEVQRRALEDERILVYGGGKPRRHESSSLR